MQFLCLGYLDMDRFDAVPDDSKHAILSECMRLCEPFRATGKVTFEAGVEHYSKAVSLRPSGTKTETYFPQQLQIGSVFIIEADSMEAAIEVASLHPAAQLGEEYGFGIEIRPLK